MGSVILTVLDCITGISRIVSKHCGDDNNEFCRAHATNRRDLTVFTGFNKDLGKILQIKYIVT
jgi:hypothetical protein